MLKNTSKYLPFCQKKLSINSLKSTNKNHIYANFRRCSPKKLPAWFIRKLITIEWSKLRRFFLEKEPKILCENWTKQPSYLFLKVFHNSRFPNLNWKPELTSLIYWPKKLQFSHQKGKHAGP